MPSGYRPPGQQVAIFFQGLHMALPVSPHTENSLLSSSYEATIPSNQDPTLMTSCNLKALPSNTVTLGFGASTYEFGRDTDQPTVSAPETPLLRGLTP